MRLVTLKSSLHKANYTLVNNSILSISNKPAKNPTQWYLLLYRDQIKSMNRRITQNNADY